MDGHDRLWRALRWFRTLVHATVSLGWRLHVAGSEAGLATGLMAVWSGCLWGAAEWGVPWDWTDVRLNSFALLTLLALVLVLVDGRSPMGSSRETLLPRRGCLGLCWFRSPTSPRAFGRSAIPDRSSPRAMGALTRPRNGRAARFAALSFTVLIVGHLMESVHLTSLEQRLDRLQGKLDAEVTE